MGGDGDNDWRDGEVEGWFMLWLFLLSTPLKYPHVRCPRPGFIPSTLYMMVIRNPHAEINGKYNSSSGITGKPAQVK
jgi:hypothetical protein